MGGVPASPRGGPLREVGAGIRDMFANHEVGGPSTLCPVVAKGSHAQSQDGRRLVGSEKLGKDHARRGPGLGPCERLRHRR